MASLTTSFSSSRILSNPMRSLGNGISDILPPEKTPALEDGESFYYWWEEIVRIRH